jgi:uncharacterized short protein YbdD (DUF466 family)
VETFPYRENIDINGLLTELERMQFICRYAVGAERFIQVLNFHKHQNPHKTEKASTIPKMPDKSESCTLTEVEPLNNGSSRADSLLLIPDSLLPITGDRATPPASPTIDLAAQFEETWAAYPKRPGASKADSLKAWRARLKAGAKTADILAGVQRYAAFVAHSRTEPQFIKQPATFFGPGEHFKADWTIGAAMPQKGTKHGNFAAQDYRAGVSADGKF